MGDRVELPKTRRPDGPWVEAVADALAGWLGARRVVVTVRDVPPATGYSHETILLDAAADDGPPHGLVVRVEPTGPTVFPDPDLARECRILTELAHQGVPVPRVVGWTADADAFGAPFAVLEHVPGEIPPDNLPYTMDGWVLAASVSQRESLWWSGVEAMAAVHRADVAALDVDLRDLEADLAYWDAYADWCGGAPDVARRAGEWLRDTAPAGQPGLCWGDARIGNQVFDGFRCRAVLDWEMANAADPVADVAWFCYFDEVFSDGLGVPRVEGFASRAETCARWEHLTGRRAHDVDWFTVYAGYRFSLVLFRLGNLRIAAGELPEDSTFPSDNFATSHLERLLVGAAT